MLGEKIGDEGAAGIGEGNGDKAAVLGAAFADDMAQEWLKTYRDIYSKSKDKGFSTEAADLTVQNQLRDRQATAGAGLVDARSGGAEIAASARWATGSVAGWQEVGARIELLRHDMNQANQGNHFVKHEK